MGGRVCVPLRVWCKITKWQIKHNNGHTNMYIKTTKNTQQRKKIQIKVNHIKKQKTNTNKNI